MQDGLMDRRRFAQQLTVGTSGLAATLVASRGIGAEIPPAPKLPEDPAPKPAPPDEAQTPPPEVLLLSYLVRTYPSEHFDEPALQGIFRDIRGDLARGQMLSEFPLKNADEPAFVFSPYRSADGLAVEG